MRITKEMANTIANTLTKGKREEIYLLKEQMSEYATQLCEKTVPSEIKKIFLDERHKLFINTASVASLSGVGLSNNYIKLLKDVPKACGNTSFALVLRTSDSNVFTDFINKINKLEKEAKALRVDIEEAVFNSRTSNNLQKSFPAAYELLPKEKQNTGLMVNVSSIMDRLK